MSNICVDTTLVKGLAEHFSAHATRDNNTSPRLAHTEMLKPGDSPLLVEVAKLVTPKLAELGAVLFGERLAWAIEEMWVNVLETGGQSDPAWLYQLAHGAGQNLLALRYGMLAAEIASTSLAFERSAELYASCLTLTDAPEQLAKLWVKLGLALARCRRGGQAADAYMKASEYVAETERVPLLQLAASHLLRSGRYTEGEGLVQRIIEALHIDMPATKAGYYAAIAW